MRKVAWIIALGLWAAAPADAELPPFYRVVRSWRSQRLDVAERYMRQVEPGTPARTAAEGIVHAMKGEFAIAQRKLAEVHEIVGRNHSLVRELHGLCCALNGDFERAREILVEDDGGLVRASVMGPFRDRYPLAAPLLEQVTESGRYRIVSDVNLPIPLEELEQRLQAAEDPRDRQRLIDEVRAKHTTLKELGEIVDKAYLNFERVFGELRKVDGISTVYVLSSRKLYREFYTAMGSDPHGTLGSYFPQTRALVFYDDKGIFEPVLCVRQKTLLVLIHEQFHQYIHLCMDRTPSWINEGLADYFGHRLSRELLLQAAPDKAPKYPARLKEVTLLLRGNKKLGEPVSVRELMNLTRKAFYGRTKGKRPKSGVRSRNYAQAWAVVDFLARTKKGRDALKAYLKGWADGRPQGQLTDQLLRNRRALAGLERGWRRHGHKLHDHYIKDYPLMEGWFELHGSPKPKEPADTSAEPREVSLRR